MPSIRLRAPEGAISFTHDRDTYPVENGFIEVGSTSAAEVAKSHGYVDDKAPKPIPPATISGDMVAIPREQFFTGLKALGIVLAEGIPADKLVVAFMEGCTKQDARLKFEINANDRKHADRLEGEVAAAEKRGEERALAALSTKADADPEQGAAPDKKA